MLSGKSSAVGIGSTFGVSKKLNNEKGRKNQKIKDIAAAAAIQQKTFTLGDSDE